MEEIYKKVCEIFKDVENVKIHPYRGFENEEIDFNIGKRWFVIDKDSKTGLYSLQENLAGYESNYDYLGILLYESKQIGRIYSRLKTLANNPFAPILGAKLI